MNTFINLALILEINETTLKEIEHLLDLIENYPLEVSVTHPEEGDYEDWTEEPVENTDLYSLIDKLAYRGAYANFKLKLDDSWIEFKLTTNNEDEQIVVNLEFDQETLQKDIKKTDAILKSIIRQIDASLDYIYMYADHEAQYLYTKERLLELGFNPYSLLKLFERELVEAPWYPDGQSLRNQ